MSKLCKDIDEPCRRVPDPPAPPANGPYLWLDATYLKVRQGGRIRNRRPHIAVAAKHRGTPWIIGLR